MARLDHLRQVVKANSQPYKSTSDYVAHTLREAILSGALPHGMSLRQEELARELSVSRMPIRDALRVLEAEGLVTFKARHGFSVTEFSADQVLEVSEIRFSLESLALQNAVSHHTPETLCDASDLLAELNQVENPESLSVRPLKHRQFHLSLYRPCGKERLLGLIEAHLVLSERFSRIGSSQFPLVVERDIDEHQQLLNAVSTGDIGGALDILHNHILGQAHEVVDKLADMATR